MASAVGDRRRAASLCAVVQRERRRLARAQSVLGCLAMALDQPAAESAESGGEEQPDFADVASVARALVNEAIDRLDEVHIERHRRRQNPPG